MTGNLLPSPSLNNPERGEREAHHSPGLACPTTNHSSLVTRPTVCTDRNWYSRRAGGRVDTYRLPQRDPHNVVRSPAGHTDRHLATYPVAGGHQYPARVGRSKPVRPGATVTHRAGNPAIQRLSARLASWPASGLALSRPDPTRRASQAAVSGASRRHMHMLARGAWTDASHSIDR